MFHKNVNRNINTSLKVIEFFFIYFECFYKHGCLYINNYIPYIINMKILHYVIRNLFCKKDYKQSGKITE